MFDLIKSVPIGICVGIISYIIACAINLWYFTIAYSKDGRWRHSSWSNFDNILIFCPIVNIIVIIVELVHGSPYDKIR